MNKIGELAAAFSNELRNLMEWEERETGKVIANLKSEGKILGLDSCPEAFAAIRAERAHRLHEIFEKYNLPPDTKLKLW